MRVHRRALRVPLPRPGAEWPNCAPWHQNGSGPSFKASSELRSHDLDVSPMLQRRLLSGSAARRSFFGTSWDKVEDPQMEELFSAAKRGRMDIAFKLAGPLAEAEGTGETPAKFVARQCSDHAAKFHIDGKEDRESGVTLATAGATFHLPGRGEIKPAHLGAGFWLKKVSKEHERADSIFRLCRASLALRGLESAEAVQRLEAQCQVGEASAMAEAASAGRDYQLIGKAVVTRLRTSRSCAVLQAFVARAFVEDATLPARCPALFGLLVKSGRHFTSALDDPEPSGPLEEPSRHHDCMLLHKFSERRQEACLKQMRIVAEIVSEAATNLLPDREDKIALLGVAEAFFNEECPLAERRKALAVFRATAERIR